MGNTDGLHLQWRLAGEPETKTIFDLAEVWLPSDDEPAVDIEHHFRIVSVFNINSYVGLDVHGSGGLVVKGLV